MNNRCTDPIGSIGWTERTGGVLTLREGLALAGPLVRDELRIAVGFLALGLRRHSGRHTVLHPAILVPPDSSIARDAEEAAQDRLTPAVLNHSRRAYAWRRPSPRCTIMFDPELLYVAAMFHDLWRAEARQVARGRAWYLHRFALTDVTIRLAPFRG